MGGTSKPTTKEHDGKRRNPAALHVSTACDDTVAVLDSLGIVRASLLFECAGTPFALAFATKYKERTTEKFMGIGSWVLPADCPKNKLLYRFGANYCPLWLASPLVASSMSGMMYSFTSLPAEWINSRFNKVFSDEEREVFDASFSVTEFMGAMKWMMEEKGGLTEDVSVLLSKGKDVGVEYDRVCGSVLLFHAEKDTLTPVACAKWLAETLPSAALTVLPDASHEGTLFMLHALIIESLKSLGR